MESEVVQLPLSDKLWAWLEANRKQVTWGAGIVLGLGIIIGYMVWQRGEKEASAGAALSRVLMTQMTGVPRTDTAEAFLKVAADYPGSKASARALLLAAGLLFDQGNFLRAQTLFERFMHEHPDSPFVAQASLGAAACLEAEGKMPEAMEAYKTLVSRYPTDAAVPQAKFALARLYQLQSKFDQARSLLQEVERAVPYGTLGDEAAMQLRELELKHPSLAVSAVPSATAPPAKLPLVLPKK